VLAFRSSDILETTQNKLSYSFFAITWHSQVMIYVTRHSRATVLIFVTRHSRATVLIFVTRHSRATVLIFVTRHSRATALSDKYQFVHWVICPFVTLLKHLYLYRQPGTVSLIDVINLFLI